VICSFFLMYSTLSLHAQTVNTENITLKVQNQPVSDVFNEISKQTGLKFFYGQTVVSGQMLISLNLTNASLNNVLSEITRQTNLQFSREDNTISVSLSQPVARAGGGYY
ncbi:MAG: STN domain-containing protein, partial [Tannerellaceae bacterium]|nr:STN domain-containing protein [Tannerellaceae bacterium]